MENIGYVYGLDYASKVDYFGITIHGLPAYTPPGFCPQCNLQTIVDKVCQECQMVLPDNLNLPRLKTLLDLFDFNDYTEALRMLEEDLFPKYPPKKLVCDYTNERTFTDILMRDYGTKGKKLQARVEPVVFSIPTKQMLKDDGLAMIQMGYMFPNPDKVKNPATALRIRNLVNQLKQEQVITTKTGKITFDHPPGKHNDLAISWELSIHGCMASLLRHAPRGAAAIHTANPQWKNKKKPKTNKDWVPELRGIGIKVTDVAVGGPHT